MNQIQEYDLIIIGAGSVGMAAAYYATVEHQNKKVCFVEQYDGSESYTKYWSSSFSARQNRLQYPELYLTQFVVQSNKEWDRLQSLDPEKNKFNIKEGSFWFGDRNVSTNEGNIKLSHLVLNTFNNSKSQSKERIQYEYKQTFMKNSPNYMQAFKPNEDWASWSAIFQPDGGSINLKQSYNFFKNNNKATPYYNIKQMSYELNSFSEFKHKFTLKQSSEKQFQIRGKFILISTGIQTPYFLKNVMKFPQLVQDQENQYFIQQYIASYFKIDEQKLDLYKGIPTYYNFLKDKPCTKDHEYSGYGFPYHEWDQPVARDGKNIIGNYVKLGTMACDTIQGQQNLRRLIEQHSTNNWTPNEKDHRVVAAKKYVKDHMNFLSAEDSYHYYCPIIFYKNRETVFDYLFRKYTDIVVQSGGWVGKYFPLLAKTAVQMLFNPKIIKMQRNQGTVIGNFLNRTRFPIKSYVNYQISQFKLPQDPKFDTVIVGAGCSGLYSAYRLHQAFRLDKQNNRKIAVFDLSYRISGRLKSFQFKGTSTVFQLGGMRYIPDNHKLLNKIIHDLSIPNIEFKMDGDPLQNSVKRSYLRQMYYQINQWEDTQANGHKLMTTYKIRGLIVGMDAFQIISFSMYHILTAPWNIPTLILAFLLKSKEQIKKQREEEQRDTDKYVHKSDMYYRTWYNYIKKQNNLVYSVNMTLWQWNFVRNFLLYRQDGLIQNSQQIQWDNKPEQLRPLYKFGFQNIIEQQFGHEAYQFVADQNGYYSNTSNAAYFDQVLTYLLDFGDVKYHTLIDGFDQINYNLANSLLHRQTGFKDEEGIYLGHKLVNIQNINLNDCQFKYKLTFHVQKKKPVTNEQIQSSSFSKDNILKSKKQIRLKKQVSKYDQKIVYAKNVVFGMPRKSIVNLYNESQLLQEDLTNYNKSSVQNKKILMNQIKEFLPQQQRQGFQSNLNQLKKNVESLLKQQKLQNINFTLNLVNDILQKQKGVIQQWIQQNYKNIRYYFNCLKQLFGSTSNTFQELESEQKGIVRIFQIISFLLVVKKDLKKLLQYLKSWFKALDNFQQDPPLQPTNLLQLTSCTQQMPAMKIAMNFDRNWWDPNIYNNTKYQQTHKNLTLINNAEQMRGLSNTDLPIRQTLYFALGQDNLLLASYNDMITTQFWTVLQNNFKNPWKPTRYLNKNNPEKLQNSQQDIKNFEEQTNKLKYRPGDQIYSGKQPLVKAVLRQLSLTHQKKIDQAWLKQVIFQFWGNDPFGAGYHNFYSGYNIQNVMRCIRKPWKEQNLHFIGEAYSNETGWVEGAFQTAQRLLTEQFKLPELLSGYYPGY